MLARLAFASSRRVTSLHSLRNYAVLSAMKTNTRGSVIISRQIQPVYSPAVNMIQKRWSQIEIFDPVEPPKQLTFEEVKERVLKAIRSWDRFPQDRNDQLTLDANFVNDLGFDSLDRVEIVMSLEDEFGYEIPDADADKMNSPRDICNYICEKEDVYE